MSVLDDSAWPKARFGDAIRGLAQRTGLALREAEALPVPLTLKGEGLSRWLQGSAMTLGLELEPFSAPFEAVAESLAGASPALLRWPEGRQEWALALVRVRRGRACLLGPDLRERWLEVGALEGALTATLTREWEPRLAPLIEKVGVDGARRRQVQRVLLGEMVGRRAVWMGWMLHPSATESFWSQARGAGLSGLAAGAVAAHALEVGFFVLGWWLIARGALGGHPQRAWLQAWALALGSSLAVGLLGAWIKGQLSIGFGRLLKRRLMSGTLNLKPSEVGHQGAGQLLGRVFEAEAAEALSLLGGLGAVLALVEWGMAMAVLGSGLGGWVHVGLGVAWLAVTASLVWRVWRGVSAWSALRLELTHGLVEDLVGHRTRLVQQDPARWHEGEDLGLERAQEVSREMDRASAALQAMIPRGWLLVGLAGLIPSIAAGGATAPQVALSIGGVVLAWQAFSAISQGLGALCWAAVAWGQIHDLFEAAGRRSPAPDPTLSLIGGGASGPLLELRAASFKHPGRDRAAVSRCSLQIQRGDRILLRGPSGGGKSTLAAVISGLVEPDEGLLLLGGLDRRSLGVGAWRRRVASAPQFHENHVLTASLAFNLLMGRRGPADAVDLEEAELICRELGLGELIDRMPSKMLQMVGETGWQLSHGERSRIFLARALLQGAELVVLDESFAALDPESLREALECVRRRAPALIVIAHP